MEIEGQVCRTCLKGDAKLVPLDVKFENELQGKKMLEFLIGTDVLDCEAFSGICESCKSTLTVSCNFKQQCMVSNEKIIEPQKPKCCRECDISFPNAREYYVHYKEERGHLGPYRRKRKGLVISKKEKVACEICGKCVSRTSIASHHLVHVKENTCFCALCGRGFKAKKYLEIHMKIHTQEKNYTCKYCEMSFVHSHTLKAHILKLHETHKQSKEVFQCTICDKKLKRKHYMECHMRRHRRDFQHECPTCQKKGDDNLIPLDVKFENELQGKKMLEFLIGTDVLDCEAFSGICEPCKSTLTVSCNFKQQCMVSNEKIIEYLLEKEQNHNVGEDENSQLKDPLSDDDDEIPAELVVKKEDPDTFHEAAEQFELPKSSEGIDTTKKDKKKIKPRRSSRIVERKCITCQLDFPNVSAYQEHYRRKHRKKQNQKPPGMIKKRGLLPKSERINHCGICEKSFKGLSNYQDHCYNLSQNTH
uniref:C2H2-type domain-containing protein n=1 Tax=Lutzomyia longipalpis TaxID=7200 RepID=A0A1B0CR37_LUTLO